MNYNKNRSCYKFQEIQFNNGVLTNVDATYIIHLENNGRYKNIEEQLKQYHPSDRVFIVVNEGYKKCNKLLPENNSTYDLIDAYLNVMQHSIEHDYKNILVLEDDFQFSNQFLEKTHSSSVDQFIKTNEDTDFIYFLGAIPILKIPILKHHRNIASLGTHAVIYSSKMQHSLIKNRENARDWDLYLIRFNDKRYMYYMPLCYQTFPDTENSQCWGNTVEVLGISLSFFGSFGKNILHYLELDVKVEPGYTIVYHISTFLTVFICLLIVYILYMTCVQTKRILMNKKF